MTNHTAERIHDERTLELLQDLATAEFRLHAARSILRYNSRPKSIRFERDDHRTPAQIQADHEALRNSPDTTPWVKADAVRDYARFLERSDEMLAVGRALHAHEEGYTGWQRFWLVVSSAGLVHASRDCHTCNKGAKPTRFALLASLSGQPIDKLVEAIGPALCSVCFPQAPTEWTDAVRIPAWIAAVLLNNGIEAFERALSDHRIKVAARAAAKAAKA